MILIENQIPESQGKELHNVGAIVCHYFAENMFLKRAKRHLIK